MYEQICNILKQNNVQYEHIIWSTYETNIVLDDGQFPIIEYLVGDDKHQNLKYIWLLVKNGVNKEERGYIIRQHFNLNGITVLILDEPINASQKKQEIEEQHKDEEKE